MRYYTLPGTDLEVSAVGLGTWAMGDDFFGKVADSESIAAIQAAVDSGINVVDTAPVYGDGHSEEVVGKGIAGRREKVILSTKCGNRRTKTGFERDFSPEFLRTGIEDSLRRLKTDTIDLYFIHWPDPERPLEPGLRVLEDLQKSGKFRYLALSNFSVELIEEVRSVAEVYCLQPHYSVLKREIEADVLPYATEHQIGVMSYGTLAGGILTGKYREIPDFPPGDLRARFYRFFDESVWGGVQDLLDVMRTVADEKSCSVPAVAIGWSRKHDAVKTVLVGAKTADQAIQNAAAGDVELTDEEYRRINAAADKFL